MPFAAGTLKAATPTFVSTSKTSTLPLPQLPTQTCEPSGVTAMDWGKSAVGSVVPVNFIVVKSITYTTDPGRATWSATYAREPSGRMPIPLGRIGTPLNGGSEMVCDTAKFLRLITEMVASSTLETSAD